MQDFIWDSSVWNEYINGQGLAEYKPIGEMNGDYVGAIRLDEFVPVDKEVNVVKLHQRFTQTQLDIAI